MSAHDETEKVLRNIHVLLSKSEPYNKEPSKVIVDKQQVLDLLSDLNKCIYNIMDEYELTQQSRDRAEREFRKQGDDIIWDASRKAEDIYAASVMYTDEALNRVWDIMHNNLEEMQSMTAKMEEALKEQEKKVKTNQIELKSQLQDLRDTEKYISLIEERNREIQKQKEAGTPKHKKEPSIYANRQSEIKVNMEYLEKMGYGPVDDIPEEEPDEQGNATEAQAGSVGMAAEVKDKKDMTPEELEREEQLRADLDADYFEWIDTEKPSEKKEGSKGLSKMWKNLTSDKK